MLSNLSYITLICLIHLLTCKAVKSWLVKQSSLKNAMLILTLIYQKYLYNLGLLLTLFYLQTAECWPCLFPCCSFIVRICSTLSSMPYLWTLLENWLINWLTGWFRLLPTADIGLQTVFPEFFDQFLAFSPLMNNNFWYMIKTPCGLIDSSSHKWLKTQAFWVCYSAF